MKNTNKGTAPGTKSCFFTGLFMRILYRMAIFMKSYRKCVALILCAAVLLGTISACGKTGNESQSSVSQAPESEGSQSGVSQAPENSGAQGSPSAESVLDRTDPDARIVLSGSGASVEGNGAAAEGGVVTITRGGLYTASGSLEDGRIIVNAPDQDVIVSLDGADITCSYGSPIYVYKAKTATIYLEEGTENALADGGDYTYNDPYSSAAEDEPNACLYSKADLVIEGAGKLTVTANHDNGITSKDTLLISGAALFVDAVNNGINGKDSNTIDGAAVTVSCGGDAIRSTNDTDSALGWIQVSDSTLELTAGEDGIQAETSLSMSGGSCTVTSGGGSGTQPAEDTSAKGIKAGTNLTLASGSYVLDCSDDAVHANGDVTVSGGSYTVSTGDDAFHADQALAISDGEIEILASYEGLEGTSVKLSGGTVRVTSSDDGVNAAGGADNSGFGGFGPGNRFGGGNSDSYIDISGGYLVVSAGGDGLDSNGSMAMSGGTAIVSSTGQGDGALDYDGSFTLSGGSLVAVGSKNMAQAPSEASQYTVSIGFESVLAQGTYVSLAGQGESFVFELPVDASYMLVSLPGLVGGGEYAVSYGGSYSGESVDGVCSGGSYSGGTDLTELSLSDYITTYGSGGMGGRPGGAMGGGPKGDRGEMPPEGAPREKFPGGMPEDGAGQETPTGI